MANPDANIDAAKTALRQSTLETRRTIDDGERHHANVLRCVDVVTIAQGIHNQQALRSADTNDHTSDSTDLFDVVDETGPLDGLIVAVYLSYGTEPGSIELANLLLDSGASVLAPVIEYDTGSLNQEAGDTPNPRWAWFYGETVLTSRGIPQPVGETLSPEALALADLIVIPGLAGGRDGSRLGTGGGWYDRALAYARTDAVRVLLLNASELYDTVPHAAHDAAVDAIVTEDGLTVTTTAH